MPGGDRTGPMGGGPMTGRRAGYCTGNPVPGYANPIPGVGFGGRGGGRGGGGRGGGGRGWRNWFYATGLTGWQRAAGVVPGVAPVVPPVVPLATPPIMGREQEIDLLKRQAEGLAGALEELNRRMAELEGRAQQSV